MKAFQIGEQLGVTSLTAVERAPLAPAPGMAVIRVIAVCLGHRDLSIVSGKYGARRPAERIPVSEGVGEVLALGEGATGVAVGDRVVCGHFTTWLTDPFAPSAFGSDLGVTHDGWLAEQAAVPASALVKVPAGLSDTQAGALTASALTAWNAVVEVGKVKAGDWVLALGTGGVSISALQIAKMNGARVVITSSSDDKLALARELGADATINYRTTPDWAAEVNKLTGRGADIVVETGGQATLSQSIAAAAVNGRIVIIGALAGAASEGLPNFGALIGKNLTLRGIAAGSRAMLVDLVAAVEANGMTPVIGKSFPFDQAPAAYAYLESGANVGKVMITL
ncbi:MAG: zinc-dependent alcohol dehydrogenase family protein [Caulobacteraceae bacterium]